MPIQYIQHFLKSRFRALLICLMLVCFSFVSRASHIFGMDLYYTHVSGNTYTVYLAVYGDCAGAAFSTLPGSSPVVGVYNGGSYHSTLNLSVQSPSSGVEVTPVCPADAGNTTCTNPSNPLPGIKKFLYAANVTLPGASSVWRFVFGSGMGGSATAGRSGSITNITFGSSGSPIELVDTLNNTTTANSNAVYTTIPTPFFCISSPANYNPGSVDPDGDNLSFYLVPGIDASTGSSVNYVWPYTPTAPLGVSSGTFSFSTATGQMSFILNIVQKALVVYNVRETTASGVLKGTSQREMTMVVLSPCTNTAPTGGLSSASAGTIASSTQLNICNSVDTFSFHINPTDAEHDSITMSVAGLPAGATFSIVNNNSRAPLGTFTWEASTTAPGTYTFFVTYQDNGCPLVGKQTIAYSITIMPTPGESVAIVSQPTCLRKGIITVTPIGSFSPFTITELAGSSTVHTFTGVTGTQTDSLNPGTYTIRIYNPDFCYKDTVITLIAPALPTGSVSLSTPGCPGAATGSLTVNGTTGATPFQYSVGFGSFTTSGVFSGLAAGTYTVHIKDANGCIKDTTVVLPDAPPILETFSIQKPLCDTFSNGIVIIHAYNSTAPYTFAVGTGSYTTSDTFSSLSAGTYVFHIKNSRGCIDDTTLTLTDSTTLHGSISISSILCNGGSASVTISGTSGFAPYTYSYNSSSFVSAGSFSMVAGSYTLHVRDTEACYFDTTISLTQPTPITISPSIRPISCNGSTNDTVVIAASGGTPRYTYTADGGSYTTSDTIRSLTAGTHVLYVKDANGCIYTDTINVTEPSGIGIDSVLLVSPTCHGGADGAIRIYASGGVPGYTYALNSGAFSASYAATGLTGATYILHIKDAHGCIKDTTVTLSQPRAVFPTASVTESSCATLDNGFVSLAGSGGTPGYTYALGSGGYSGAGNFFSLPAGTFTFHIKDAHGCIADTSITITNIFHISGLFIITPPACFGCADGVVTVACAGGTAPYIFAFGSSAYTDTTTYNSLAAGTYVFHIRDSIGCIGDTSIAVTQPDFLTPVLTFSQPTCFGMSNGVIGLAGAGGTPSYQFALNSSAFASVSSFPGLPAGVDTITVKDAHGCVHDTIVTMGQPAPLGITNLTITEVSCNAGNDGIVAIAATGGTPAYRYAANSSAFQTSNILTGLSAGLVTIRLKDSNGCEVDSSIMLTQPAKLWFGSVAITNPTCQGYPDGGVVVAGAGGTTPYTFSKDGFSFTTNTYFGGLKEGIDTFYISDAHHCTTDTVINLVGYPHINIDSIISNLYCYGTATGDVTVYATGGVQPLFYGFSDSVQHPAPNEFSGVHFGYYTVTITDSKGCTKDSTFFIRQPDSMMIITTVTPNECIGKEVHGTITLDILGGTAPFSYLWSVDSATTPYLKDEPNGIYTVTVTDGHQCTNSTSAKISYDDCCIPFLPNSFTPNGDGNNDEFRVKFKGDLTIIQFAVFDRFGERFFLSEYSGRGWDGTYKGVQAEIGTYYYYVRFICGNGSDKVQELKGDVILIR